MDGSSGLPLVALRNPGHLLRQTKLPGQENRSDAKKEPWPREAFEKKNVPGEMSNPNWKSCRGYGEVRSTLNITRLKEHLMECVPFLLSPAAEAVAIKDAKMRPAVQRAKAAPPSGMGQSTLTVDRSSVKRKLMRAFADELTQANQGSCKSCLLKWLLQQTFPTLGWSMGQCRNCSRPFVQPSSCPRGTSSALHFCWASTQ